MTITVCYDESDCCADAPTRCTERCSGVGRRLGREALRLIARDRELDRRFRLMLTIPGIGETSALLQYP